MRVVLDTGVTRDLTSSEISRLDAKLRSRIPELKGWSYSPITGELVLELPNFLTSKCSDFVSKAEARGVKEIILFQERLKAEGIE